MSKNFTRDDLTGPSVKAIEALDWVDSYMKYSKAPYGVLHMYAAHWDFINNALKRNKRKQVSATTHTYRGLKLVRVPPR